MLNILNSLCLGLFYIFLANFHKLRKRGKTENSDSLMKHVLLCTEFFIPVSRFGKMKRAFMLWM